MTRLVAFVPALCVSVFVLAGCGGEPSSSSPAPDAPAEQSLDQMLANGDIERGKMLYFQCRACHSLENGGMHKVGPNLHGVFERKAGLAEGFAYSEAMTAADTVWTNEAMDEWLARPSTFMPGNRMVFVGIKDARDRANLIAYLRKETGAD